MATRNSGYARQPLDRYVTHRWVYEQLWSVDPRFEHAIDVAPVDDDAFDFLTHDWASPPPIIATNPPFKLATQFCRRAIEVTKPVNGAVAMLLPMSFDCAKGRRDLWQHPFAGKHVLTARIRWENLLQKSAGPSIRASWNSVSVADASRLATILAAMRQCLEASELERRIAEMEAALTPAGSTQSIVPFRSRR